MKKALFIYFQLYISFIEFFSLFYFFFVHVLTVSYNMYKTQKMPAHVHLQIDALYSFHYIFILHFRI